MKKSNKLFSISALILVLAGFMFTSTSVVFSDEKKAEDAAATADTDTAKDTDGKDKKKKNGDDDEEPECE